MTRPIQADGLLHGAVVGVRRDDGRWLLIRRSAHVMSPGSICFPGGAIELGESPPDAARREIKEELGIDVTLIRQVWDYHCPDRPLRLFGWLGKVDSCDFVVDEYEIAETLWLTRDEVLSHPDVLAGTEDFIAKLESAARPSVVEGDD